jgi:hypothetical protein
MGNTTSIEIGQTSYAPDVPGRGADVRPEHRPGVPMYREPPRPLPGAHWREPERQPPRTDLTKRMELDTLTPVFGTAQPPRGLSGAIRRAAYNIPQHCARHWMLLFLADRVDVIEHGKSARKWIALAAPALLATAAAVLTRANRRSQRRSLGRLLRAAAW